MTFNAALKPLIAIFSTASTEESYVALAAYIAAFIEGGKALKAETHLTKPQVFRAIMTLFRDVAQKVQDRHGKDYTVPHFDEALKPMFGRLKSTLWSDTSSYVSLHGQMANALKTSFTL